MYSTKILRNVTRKIVIKTTVHACATPKLTDAMQKTTVHEMDKEAQITAKRDESQRIVGQSPLSTLTIPGCC